MLFKKTSIFNRFYLYVCLWEYMPCVDMPVEVRRRHQILRIWSYSWLWAAGCGQWSGFLDSVSLSWLETSMCYLPNSWGISNEVLSIKPVFTEWGKQASGWTWYLPWNLRGVSPEISALKRQRKEGACKFGANLVYRVHFRPTWAINWVPSQINNNKTTTKLQSIAPGSYDTAPLGQEAWNICALWLQRRLPNNPAWAEPDFCWALYKLTASTRHSWE